MFVCVCGFWEDGGERRGKGDGRGDGRRVYTLSSSTISPSRCHLLAIFSSQHMHSSIHASSSSDLLVFPLPLPHPSIHLYPTPPSHPHTPINPSQTPSSQPPKPLESIHQDYRKQEYENQQTTIEEHGTYASKSTSFQYLEKKRKADKGNT